MPESVSAGHVLGWLVARVAEELEKEPAEIDTRLPLSELGFDSLDVLDLVLALETEFGLQIDPGGRDEDLSLAELAARLPASAAATVATVPVAVATVPAVTSNPTAVFVLACPRSGSTLLRVMLAGHPGLFAPPELHLLPFSSMRERQQSLRQERLDEGLQRAFMELEGVDAATARYHIDTMIDADRPVAEVYAELQQLAGDRILVDKSPINAFIPTALAAAEAMFDHPRYIFLTRHPHATIDSLMGHRFEWVYRDFAALLPQPLADRQALAEWAWVTAADTVRTFLAGIDPSRGLHVRFEDLVAEPRRTAETVCQFLGLELDEAVLKPYAGRRMTDGVRPNEPALGDPRFTDHAVIDVAKGEAWRDVTLDAPIGERVRRVATELGYEFPGADLADAATSPLVPLQPHGEAPPLILVHPAGGLLYPYFELVAALGDRRPVYGLRESVGSDGPGPRASVQAYAEDYLAAVRERQPRGPYLLGGWSFGGHVAIAMARMLRDAGEEVATVVLLDTEAPVDRQSMSLWGRFRQRLRWARAVATGGGDLIAMCREIAALLRASRGEQRQDAPEVEGLRDSILLASIQARRKRASPTGMRGARERVPALDRARARSDTMLRMSRRIHYHFDLLNRYRPQQYGGDVALIRARDQSIRSYQTSAGLGWEGLVGGRLDIREVGGNHLTIGQAPNVDGLAEAIHESIETALSLRMTGRSRS